MAKEVSGKERFVNDTVFDPTSDALEWAHMWRRLGADERMNFPRYDLVGGPTVAQCPDTGETWQYMGSVQYLPKTPWLHEFRHRWHPVLQRREYRRYKASEGWQPPTWQVKPWEVRKLLTAPAEERRAS